MGLATGIQSRKFLNGKQDGIDALTTNVSPASAASIKKGLSDHSQVLFYHVFLVGSASFELATPAV